MESALLNILGLALAYLATLRGGRRSAPVAVDGQNVIASCLKAQPEATATVIQRSAASFWAHLATIDAPRSELELHIEEIASLVKAAGGYTSNETSAGTHDGEISAQAGAIVHTIVADARQLPRFEAGVDDQSRATLEALFRSLLLSGEHLAVCLDAIVQDFAKATPRPQSAAEKLEIRALAKLKQQLVSSTGISQLLLDAIVTAQVKIGNRPAAIAPTLVDRAVLALELLTDLMHLSERTGADENLESELLHTVDMVRSGRIGAARDALVALSLQLEHSTDFDDRLAPDLTGTAFFPSLLVAQARLANLDGALRDAALLFDRAGQLWPRNDRMKRWQIKIAQARQLAELARLPGAHINVLCESAKVYAVAGGFVSEVDCPLAWAEATLELGNLLLQIGDRECRLERYLAAALHFKPALEVFTRERAMDGWARAQIGLAHSLRGQAAHQSDVIVAREAAFAYRAALGVLTKDATPGLWHEARCGLGDMLVMIAEESGDVQSLHKALDDLMPYLDSAPDTIGEPARSICDLALGRAMLILVDGEPALRDEADNIASDDAVLLSDAIDLLARSLDREHVQLTTFERARAERALGHAQGLYFQRTGEADVLAYAIAAKKRARDLYEHLDNQVAVDDISSEITALEEAAASEFDQGYCNRMTDADVDQKRPLHTLTPHALELRGDIFAG